MDAVSLDLTTWERGTLKTSQRWRNWPTNTSSHSTNNSSGNHFSNPSLKEKHNHCEEESQVKAQSLGSKGYECWKLGYFSTWCSFKLESTKSLPRYFKCDKVGHMLKGCRSVVKVAEPQFTNIKNIQPSCFKCFTSSNSRSFQNSLKQSLNLPIAFFMLQ